MDTIGVAGLVVPVQGAFPVRPLFPVIIPMSAMAEADIQSAR